VTDVHDVATRSRNMSAIRGENTRPELAVRKALHAAGFRYRLHSRVLPGKPDLVLPKYRAVIFVHGCFWHRHGCSAFKMPAERADFWQRKLQANVDRDRHVQEQLMQQGWRVAQVWECSLRGRNRQPIGVLASTLGDWLGSDLLSIEQIGIAGYAGEHEQDRAIKLWTNTSSSRRSGKS
jgi:DNA mismatch endonuclease, patch repair protein